MIDIKNGIENLEFKSISELAEVMFEGDEGNRVAVLPYYKAIRLVRELLLYENVGVEYLDWNMPEYNNYDGCYYIALDNEDYLSIEPCYRDGHFILCGGDIMYIDGEAEYEIMHKNADEFDEMYEACFADEYGDEPEYDDNLYNLEDDDEDADSGCEHCTDSNIVNIEIYIDGKKATLSDVSAFVRKLFNSVNGI